MVNKTLLEPSSRHTAEASAMTETGNQFANTINMKQPPISTDQQEHATIHRNNVHIPVTTFKLLPDFHKRQFDSVFQFLDLGFMVLQHPYINIFCGIALAVDAKRAIHIKDI